MPNKFQKIIQERQTALAYNAARHETAAQHTDSGMVHSETNTRIIEVIAPETDPPAQRTPTQKTDGKIDSYLHPPNTRVAKNKTFYLDEDVISALRHAAQTRQVTYSKIVNDILRTVLVDEK